MANEIMTQAQHDENRFNMVLKWIGDLQAQNWATTEVLNKLSKVENMPKEAVDILSSYEDRVAELRRKIPLGQAP